MLNPLSVFRLGNPAQQQRQTATAPTAKQHASLKEAESSTPSRRALAPVTGNQVNTMQRIKNFVSGPSASTFTVANDVMQQTASAKKVSHQHTCQNCFTLCVMPFHMLFSRLAALVRHLNPFQPPCVHSAQALSRCVVSAVPAPGVCCF
jgi:hypothetical protein